MPRRNSNDSDTSTTTQGVQHAVVSLDGLTPHPRNYRRHPESQVARLSASLARFGQVRSIVVQEGADGQYLIVAGHGLVEAARSHGLRELRADVIPPTWTPAQVEGYLIADNETTRGADDDLVALAQMLEEQQSGGFDLDALGYSQEELAALLEQLANEALAGDRRDVDDPDGGGDDFDTTPDESGPTRVQPGDLWQLGAHRLLCGDSTRAEDVARLMAGETAQMVWSDPPYGVAVVKDNMVGADFGVARKGRYVAVVGDETTDTAIDAYTLLAELYPQAAHIWWGANYYADALPASSCWLVWDKRGESGIENTFADGELAWTSMTGPARIHHQLWNGMIRSGEHEKRVHPTQKPIALAAWAFDKYGAVDDIVLDPFCGSGMSVIAGERINRNIYALEMSADYCDVILRRWEAETKREATLIERLEASDDGRKA